MTGVSSVQTMQNDNTMELQQSDWLPVAPKSLARPRTSHAYPSSLWLVHRIRKLVCGGGRDPKMTRR